MQQEKPSSKTAPAGAANTENAFGKAIAAYERPLNINDTDAEAHWGTVISQYGIEYVEDPATHERIPACHRVQIVIGPDVLAGLTKDGTTVAVGSGNYAKRTPHTGVMMP